MTHFEMNTNPLRGIFYALMLLGILGISTKAQAQYQEAEIIEEEEEDDEEIIYLNELRRTGAICQDGYKSTAIKAGACSSHGGVKYWLYTEEAEHYRQQSNLPVISPRGLIRLAPHEVEYILRRGLNVYEYLSQKQTESEKRTKKQKNSPPQTEQTPEPEQPRQITKPSESPQTQGKDSFHWLYIGLINIFIVFFVVFLMFVLIFFVVRKLMDS